MQRLFGTRTSPKKMHLLCFKQAMADNVAAHVAGSEEPMKRLPPQIGLPATTPCFTSFTQPKTVDKVLQLKTKVWEANFLHSLTAENHPPHLKKMREII
jgi:hypothetical protein